MSKSKSSMAFIMMPVAFSLSACGFLPQINVDSISDNTDYQQSRSVASLALPPGLSKPDFNTAYQVPSLSGNANALAGRNTVSVAALSQPRVTAPNLTTANRNVGAGALNGRIIQLETGQSVLAFPVPYRQLWPVVGQRLSAAGMPIVSQQPKRGIYTVRYAGNTPSTDRSRPLQRLANRLFGGAPTRVEANYLILVAENQQGSFIGVADAEGKTLDESVTREILQRLQRQMAVNNSTQVVQDNSGSDIESRIITLSSGQPALALKAPYTQIWPTTARHLQASGITIVKQQPKQGRYTIRYRSDSQEETSDTLPLQRFVDRHFNQSSEKEAAETYLILVKEVKGNSVIGVSDAQGKPVDSALAEALLKRLQAQFSG